MKTQLEQAMHALLSILMVSALVVVVLAIRRIPEHYRAQGRGECQQAVTRKTLQVVSERASAVATKASEDMAHAQATGTKFERARNRIDTHFQRLETEARHAPPSSVDLCELPPARLRLWQSANDGSSGAGTAADPGAATAQPAAAATAAAPASDRPHAGPGSQPPRGGQGLSPTGGAALRAADLPGVSHQ
jgi:hypothetical protein